MNSPSEPIAALANKVEEYADSINVRITFLIVTNLINMVIFLHSIAWLVTTVQHRNQRLAKMSSSRLNALVCVGSSLASVAVALRSLQIWWLSLDVIAAFKHASILTISIAFTLVVLTTALKALRIYILFSRPSGNLTHMKNISLQCYVACAVAIDMAICLSWYAADPIRCQNLTVSAQIGELRQQSVTLLCNSNHWYAWVGALCLFKLLLLVMLVVFSMKIRGVTLAPLNDARQNLVVAGVVGAASLLNLPILLHAGEGPQGAFGPDRITATIQVLSVFICQLAAVTGLVAFKFRELQSRSKIYKPKTCSASESQTPLAETMTRMQQQAGLFQRFLRALCPTPIAELDGSQPCSLHAVDSSNGTHCDDHRLLLEEIANLKCALSEKQQTIQNLTSNLLYDSEAFKLYLERYHRRFYSALKEVSFIEEPDDSEEIWHLQAGLSEPRDLHRQAAFSQMGEVNSFAQDSSVCTVCNPAGDYWHCAECANESAESPGKRYNAASTCRIRSHDSAFFDNCANHQMFHSQIQGDFTVCELPQHQEVATYPIGAPELTSTPVHDDRNYPNYNDGNISWCLTEV